MTTRRVIGANYKARRSLQLCLACSLFLVVGVCRANEELAWQALRQGAIVIFRHANAPGVGDLESMRLGDCSTQRNLDEAGRQQARQLGQRLRIQKVKVAQVLSSQWCRTLETAELMALGPVQGEPVFNSFFAGRNTEPAQTAAAQKLLRDWRGKGSLVVVTHQVNINAITGATPTSAEGVVLRRTGNRLEVVGRISPG